MMRRRLLTLTATVGLCLGGCPQDRWDELFRPGGDAGKPAGGGGEWAVVLERFEGPGRQGQAEKLKGYLESNKWRGVGVLHDAREQKSYVFYGPFKHGAELDANVKKVRAWTDVRGVRPFPLAFPMELPTPDPPAPREWNLARAPKNAAWTLQVMHFVDPGPAFPATEAMELPPGWNRKQAAVDACKDLRDQSIEAYYYHGEMMSLVTVGSFPASAFQCLPGKGDLKYVNYDPVTDEYLDPKVRELRDRVFKDAAGQEVKYFRYNLQNGMVVSKRHRMASGELVKKPLPSFLVEIPRGQAAPIGTP